MEKSLKFKWDMTKKEWEDLKHDNKKGNKKLSKTANVYGRCYVGNLCIDILHTLDNSSWYPFCNLFALGKDDGYGETAVGKIPYSLLDCSPSVPIKCKTFESFKQCLEAKFAECINTNNLSELAAAPLGNWE